MMKIFFFFLFFAVGKSSSFDPTHHANWKMLPHNVCGQTSSGRIIGGEEAPMNAYPWIARIGYSSKSINLKFLCGGAIITSQIILTAAHCVTDLEYGLKLKKIRLGEHDTRTNPDCDGSFCADPIMDFEPAEAFFKKDYNTPPFKNDIALIRLKTSIKFSDFIKPICLPSVKMFNVNFVGKLAEVAGWGITNFDTSEIAKVLQVIKLPIVQNLECSKILPAAAALGETQFCAGGIKGRDSCGGDSGGPLMKLSDGDGEPRYYVLGIVSFGAKKCGKTTAPAVYTKVSSLMEWILENLDQTKKSSTVISL